MRKSARLTLLGLSFCLQSTSIQAQNIILPQASVAQGQHEARAAPVGDSINAKPAVRDTLFNAPATTVSQKTLMKLRPSARLPQDVRMGASLPQPGVLRLTGEVAQIDLVLDLSSNQNLPDTLQLALRSAINVLPDKANLELRVNDAAPINLALNNFDDFKLIHVPIDNFVSGPNRISISIRQQHRIYCGPDASFGVWTEFDLARSGVPLMQSALPPSPAWFELELLQQVASGLPVTLLADSAEAPAALRQLTEVLGAAMQGMGWVEIRSPYDISPRQGPSVALIASDRDQISYRPDGRGAPTMVVEHKGDSLPTIEAVVEELAFPVEAAAQLLPPGETRSFAELGQPDIIGNTHYFRHDIQFRLPDDWLLLANQKATLNLRYGYAQNMPHGSILLVKVNEKTVRLLPLDREGGKLLEPLAVGFGARLLHSGANTLSLEMMVPGNPSDVACPPRQTDMLVVTSDSSLLVPHSPAMQLGGFASSLTGLTAGGITIDPISADRGRMDMAAIQLAAGLRPSADPDPAVTLTLSDFSTLPTSLGNVSLRELQEALFPISAVPLPMTVPSAMTSLPTSKFRLSESSPDTAPPNAPVAVTPRWSPKGWLNDQTDWLKKSAFISSGESLSQWLTGRRGDAMLIALDKSEPKALGLIVGPDAQMRGISLAINTLRSQRLGQGAVALLSNDGSWQIWSPVEPPHLKEQITLMNIFPIMGNLASWSPFLFAISFLVLGLLSIVPALMIIIIFRKARLR